MTATFGVRRRRAAAASWAALALVLLAAACAGKTDTVETPDEAPTGTADVTETAQQADDPAAGGAADSAGRPAPEVRFTYFDGSEGTLADFAGTPLVVNFWASWCPPCITEMPAFEAVHVELAPQVAFLGFNVGDEPGAARQLAERTGVTYPLAEDPDSAIFQVFGGIIMPTTVLVDAEGTIVHTISARLRAQDLRALITEHLGV